MLLKRILSALVGIPLLLYFIYLGDIWYTILIWLIALIGLREYFQMMRLGDKVLLFSGFVGLTALLAAVYLGSMEVVLIVITLLFLWIALNLVFRFNRSTLEETSLFFWGIIYIGGLLSYLVILRQEFVFEYTVLLLAVVWLNDTFAYFVGNAWGKRKLMPAVSPAKSVEGSLGGLLGTILLSILLYFLIPDFYQLSLLLTVVLVFVIILFAQIGDLVESAIKRKLEVKDSGNFIPGHGGILDRFDSIMYAGPFAYYFILLVNYL